MFHNLHSLFSVNATTVHLFHTFSLLFFASFKYINKNNFVMEEISLVYYFAFGPI